MSTVPRLSSAIEGEPPSFATMLHHQPELTARFWHLYATMWSHGVVDHTTKETVRLRNARLTDCGFCKNVRFARPGSSGLDDETTKHIAIGYEQSPLPEYQKRALRFADGFLVDGRLSAHVKDDLARNWSPEETTETAVAAALFLGFSKLLITMGAEPTEMETTVFPTPDTDQVL